MKKILLTSSLVLLGMTGLASADTVKTIDTKSGDCLVAEDGTLSLAEGACDDYVAGTASGSSDGGSATASRDITTSTVYEDETSGTEYGES